MDLVHYKKEGKISWLTLNQPQKRNALSLELMKEMKTRLYEISTDESVNVLIIRGNGPAFCSGHDLKELDGNHDQSYYHNIFETCSALMQLISKMPQPVIAMVHGAATAAGCQLVASCDLVVASDDAIFSTPGVKIGLFCSTPMVPIYRVVGRRRALDMLLTGRFVTAEEAKEFGLVNRVVPIGELENEAKKIAICISGYSRFTVGFGKKTFYDQIDLDQKSAYEHAVNAIVQNSVHEDAKEGIRARLEKRKPKWKT
jgi:enoyl-CoA hydratase/carnithine racemase